MDTILADVRSGVRMLSSIRRCRSSPILTLGLGHRPQHHRLLRRQRRPVQGAAVPGRRPHRLARRDQSVAEPAAAADQRAGPGGVAGAADVVREVGRVTFSPINLSARRAAGAVQRRAAERAGAFEALGVAADRSAAASARGRSPRRRAGDLLGDTLWRERYGSARRSSAAGSASTA
jgi:hypothetical protein